MNPFLAWLYEKGHTAEHLKIPRLKPEKKVMRPFTDAHLKAIIGYKPQTFYEQRFYTLICLLADTGARINEALTLTRDRVDWDNMLAPLSGKGNKERIVPFSVECRKILYKWLRQHKFPLALCNGHGGKISYSNVRRDFTRLMDTLGITEVDGSSHAFRRTFATNYIQAGRSFLFI